jgi:hypothetical protein
MFLCFGFCWLPVVARRPRPCVWLEPAVAGRVTKVTLLNRLLPPPYPPDGPVCFRIYLLLLAARRGMQAPAPGSRHTKCHLATRRRVPDGLFLACRSRGCSDGQRARDNTHTHVNITTAPQPQQPAFA